MRARDIALVTGLAALTFAGSASAMTCYLVIDRNDVVIFRDTEPPFDSHHPLVFRRLAL